MIKNKNPVMSLDTLIIGAGISGVGAAIRLMDAGMYDFLLLEKHHDVGGTWRDNTYPGCECDVPSNLYSYSFEPNNSWSKVFAGQEEILSYVRNTAGRYKVLPRVKFGITVEDAVWDEANKQWQLHTDQGLYLANKVISCAGYLHEPVLPNIPGLDQFEGEVFHSSRWNHQAELSGKRVAVIGTGASAIQFVPKIQPQVKQLTLFQRTPQWILPKPNYATSKLRQQLLKLPFTATVARTMAYTELEAFGIGFRKPSILKRLQSLAKLHINSRIKDPTLRAKLTPDYTLGCKRVLLSNDYYPALAKDNVDVHASGVTAVEGNSLIAADGSRCEADVIILGTGFHVSDVPIAKRVRGASGKTMNEIWQGSPEAYRGTTLSDFPNFFLVLGPNLAIGHNSAFIVIEAQLDYIMGALKEMRKNHTQRLEVSHIAQQKYNDTVQQALQSTVWNTGGCSSYYIDQNGKNSIGFPWSTITLKKLLAKFDAKAYSQEANPS